MDHLWTNHMPRECNVLTGLAMLKGSNLGAPGRNMWILQQKSGAVGKAVMQAGVVFMNVYCTAVRQRAPTPGVQSQLYLAVDTV